MAVLVEALSVITRKDRIEALYPGGIDGFFQDCPNRTACADDYLVRVGFMDPERVGRFIETLTQFGLVFRDQHGEAQDIVVIDQLSGPTTPCDWAEVTTVSVRGAQFTACRMAGTSDRTLACPPGWDPEQAAKQSLVFVPSGEQDSRMEFLREEDGLLVCRDRLTGKIMYSPAKPAHQSGKAASPTAVGGTQAEKTNWLQHIVRWIFPSD